LADLISITSAQLDHLLPKAKYPEYRENEDNWILACFCCNQIKRKFDPCDKLSEDRKSALSPETLSEYRAELIEICRAHLIPNLEKREKIRSQLNVILKEHNLRPTDGE
jgi:hypothetical protein